ncbi:MAG: MFS transporter [Actinomycetota bacterium]|nr:MFS transporter [Actinomycetota bacterium]
MTIDAREQTRSRLIGTMFTSNALSSTAFIGTVTVSSLVAEQITGSASLSGLPNTMGTVAAAAGAAILSALSFKFGRRRTFAAGLALAGAGSLLAALSVALNSFPLLLVSMMVLGFGWSVSHLARFAAGDLRPPERRASAISLIVWASTIGAIVGPSLIGPTSNMALTAGLDPLIGPITVGVAGFSLAAFITFVGLRPEPLTLTIAPEGEQHCEASPLSEILTMPPVRLAIVAVMTSQFVMILIMTMTPLHIRGNGGSLGTVGVVMMAHATGMFAIAPITGRLVDRHGPRPLIVASVAVLTISGLITAAAPRGNIAILVIGLFLLGVGWNFGFVAASTALQIGLPTANRLKIQGAADAIMWTSGGTAAAVSGIILGTSSFTVVAIVGAVCALAPIPFIIGTRPRAETRASG